MITFKEFMHEDAQLKQKVLKALGKRDDNDPMFAQLYKVLLSQPLSNRIESYINSRNDSDAIDNIQYLVKTIPTLGDVDEVKSFLDDLKKSNYDFVDIKKLCPPSGMTASADISTVVSNSFAKKLFDKLIDEVKGKNDAGPGEAALAILSPNITYAQGASVDEYGRGGDIIVTGVGKVEVKGGTGGRLTAVKTLDQQGMTDSLEGYTLKGKGIRPTFLSAPLPSDFPKEKFMKAACKAWFGKDNLEVIQAAGTKDFTKVWINAMYDAYRNYAGFKSVLFLTNHKYHYTTSGYQIPANYIKNCGYLYYPSTSQPREMCPQIVPK